MSIAFYHEISYRVGVHHGDIQPIYYCTERSLNIVAGLPQLYERLIVVLSLFNNTIDTVEIEASMIS
jgi:hypothetical protein